jgi:hypothetical protein
MVVVSDEWRVVVVVVVRAEGEDRGHVDGGGSGGSSGGIASSGSIDGCRSRRGYDKPECAW